MTNNYHRRAQRHEQRHEQRVIDLPSPLRDCVDQAMERDRVYFEQHPDDDWYVRPALVGEWGSAFAVVRESYVLVRRVLRGHAGLRLRIRRPHAGMFPRFEPEDGHDHLPQYALTQLCGGLRRACADHRWRIGGQCAECLLICTLRPSDLSLKLGRSDGDAIDSSHDCWFASRDRHRIGGVGGVWYSPFGGEDCGLNAGAGRAGHVGSGACLGGP